MSVSVYDSRAGYNSRSVSGDVDVADNEPVSSGVQPRSPGIPGFVVGHHVGHVTVDVHHCELTTEEAYALGVELIWRSDLSRLPWVA